MRGIDWERQEEVAGDTGPVHDCLVRECTSPKTAALQASLDDLGSAVGAGGVFPAMNLTADTQPCLEASTALCVSSSDRPHLSMLRSSQVSQPQELSPRDPNDGYCLGPALVCLHTNHKMDG